MTLLSQEYVKDNFMINSCFINCIINNYHDSFNRIKTNGERYFKELTYERLLTILDIDTNKKENVGLSIKRAIYYFFKPHRLSLEVYNLHSKLIFAFRPQKINTSIHKHLMRVVIDNNNHMALVNDNIESLDQTKNKNYYNLENIEDLTIVNNNYFDNIIVSNKFYLKKTKGDKENIENIEDIVPANNCNESANKSENDIKNNIKIDKYYLINSIKDITKIILDIENSDTKNNNCILIYNDNIENLYVDIFPIYTPDPKDIPYENGSIKSIKIIVGDYKNNNSVLISSLSIKSSNLFS